MDDRTPPQDRARAAESAVIARFVRRAGPFAWARASWPGRDRAWHYWWHAHLLDASDAAARRDPSPQRRARTVRLARTVALRTGGRWTNRFYDDISWMGLALHRALPSSRGVERIARALERGIDPQTGALPWHVGSAFRNAPANGPAAILLARTGRRAAAERMTDWIAATLVDPRTGLVRDGVDPAGLRGELYAYNQGVALGAALALADGPRRDLHLARARSLVAAVDAWCAADGGLLPSPGGGDGGLFAGILCRWLADAGRRLADDPATTDAAATARRIVRANADALWRGRLRTDPGPWFAADPRRAAAAPGIPPDRDLSVQLSAWLTLEAAASLPS